MLVCFSSASTPVNTKWSFAMAIWRGQIAAPPVIWLNVWIENGAVPSEAGSRSAYTRSVAPARTSAFLSTRCAHRICSVVVSRRAVAASGHTISGLRAVASELAPAHLEDAARAADLVLLGRQRHRVVSLAARLVREPTRVGIERERVAVLRVGDRVRALHHVEPQVERVPAEDVAHV